ncbi:HIT family protein [Sphingomonas parva]|uniref:HIT family protein n=1 Tax=Sphingomonas parva TaxID=2555898 RepID=A0A4Y8ZS89_9SPHN|nr:HIT family protein [Sphingomonas parva]TFI58890.1 HIT family protein [Sphingomonas parva]
MNETIVRFGHPETLIAEYRHWLVLLRPAQPTLGSLVLAAKSVATAYSDLPADAFAEQAMVVRDIERTLGTLVGYSRINYLMLMMVDPHVHYHVIPRYEGVRGACGIEIGDAGWPKLPALGEAVSLAPPEIAALVAWLKAAWPAAHPPRP